MNEIKLRLYLPDNASSTIFVDGNDKIIDWIRDILKNKSIQTEPEQLEILKNNSSLVSLFQSFDAAGFKNGDQLNVKKPNQNIDNNNSSFIAISDESNKINTKSDNPSIAKTISTEDTKDSTPYSKEFSAMPIPGPGRAAAIAIIAILLIITGIGSYLFFINNRSNYKAVLRRTEKPEQRGAVTNRIDKADNNSKKETNGNVIATGIQPTEHSPTDVTIYSAEGYFRRLADPNISDRKKVILKSNLLKLFSSPDAPVIKMNNGQSTNTGTTIRYYIESVSLLNTQVTIINRDVTNGKISKLYVGEK